MIKNIFDASVTNELMERINRLTPESQPLWGKMSVSQMLAHCNVTYELVYDNKHPKPGVLMRNILKLFVKKTVVSEKPYTRSMRTAPAFIMKDEKNFSVEKERLIGYLQKTQGLGGSFFEGKESNSFGPLTQIEWNNMFYKHLDHHLNQFGV